MAFPPKTWLIAAGRRSQPVLGPGFALFSIMSAEIVAPPAFDTNRLIVPDFITPYSSLGTVIAGEVSPSAYMDVTSNELVFKDAANFGRYEIYAPGAASPIPEEFVASVDFSFGDATAFPYFSMSATVGNFGSNSLGVAFSTHAGILGGVGANQLVVYFDGITLASASFIPPRVGTLSLELKNGQITASVNGAPIISVSDSFPAIDPNPLSYFFSYWPFAYFSIGARGSSTENFLNTTPVSGTITGASLFFPSLVGVRLISANQNGEGLPPGPDLGRPTVIPGAAPPVTANLSGQGIASQEAFGSFLDVIPEFLGFTSGTLIYHFDGSQASVGDLVVTSDATLETSPTKFGSGSASGFMNMMMDFPGSIPSVDNNFSLDFQVYIPTGADYAFCGFGDSFGLAIFSDTGDSFGDFQPAVTITSQCAMLYTYATSNAVIGPAGVPNLDAFNHVEVSCTSGVWRLFLNGLLLGSGTDATVNGTGNNVMFDLGAGVVIDEVRIQFGIGGHTATFTPPTAAY